MIITWDYRSQYVEVSAENKFRMSLCLPVAVTVNCAVSTGSKNLYIISVKGIKGRLSQRNPWRQKDSVFMYFEGNCAALYPPVIGRFSDCKIEKSGSETVGSKSAYNLNTLNDDT